MSAGRITTFLRIIAGWRDAYPAYKSHRLLEIQNNHTEVWLWLIPFILQGLRTGITGYWWSWWWWFRYSNHRHRRLPPATPTAELTVLTLVAEELPAETDAVRRPCRLPT